MHARTVKGSQFAIIVGAKRIVVKHVYGAKGKRCRVIMPDDVRVEESPPNEAALMDSIGDEVTTTERD